MFLCRAAAGASLVATLLLITGGCRSGNGSDPDPAIRMRTVVVVMTDGANGDWPAEVEMVRVRDANLLTELLRIESAAWFADAGEKFVKANPEALVDRWEMVPGTSVGPVNVRIRAKVTGVVFCNIPGTPPVRLSHHGHVTLRVDDEGCAIQGDQPAR